eukprot:gene16643-21245_t
MGHGNMAQWSRVFGAVAPEVAGIRRFGAASLDLAWVAAGRYDGFWESDLKIWDVAAGILLVREAGGFVSDFRGGDRAIERSEFIAGSAAVHSKLQKLVAGTQRVPEKSHDLWPGIAARLGIGVGAAAPARIVAGFGRPARQVMPGIGVEQRGGLQPCRVARRDDVA